MKRWMGPRNFTCPEAMIDFRVGDAYRAMIKSEEHGESWFSGVYREIAANERLVFTVTWMSTRVALTQFHRAVCDEPHGDRFVLRR
jgi:uncharacterized protein YndB with AHSA1/START domain